MILCSTLHCSRLLHPPGLLFSPLLFLHKKLTSVTAPYIIVSILGKEACLSWFQTAEQVLFQRQGRTGVFSWCVISWLYLPWNVNLRNCSSWFVTWRFCVTREELKLLTDIRDFRLLLVFYVMLRREPSGRFVKTENVKGSVKTLVYCTERNRNL